jgi:hypothetical protein
MFRTSYVLLQEEYIVYFDHILQSGRLLALTREKTYHIGLHVQYSLPDDEHKKCSKHVEDKKN